GDLDADLRGCPRRGLHVVASRVGVGPRHLDAGGVGARELVLDRGGVGAGERDSGGAARKELGEALGDDAELTNAEAGRRGAGTGAARRPHRGFVDAGLSGAEEGVGAAASVVAEHLRLGTDVHVVRDGGRRLHVGGDDVAGAVAARPGAGGEADAFDREAGDWRGTVSDLASEVVVYERRALAGRDADVADEGVEDADALELAADRARELERVDGARAAVRAGGLDAAAGPGASAVAVGGAETSAGAAVGVGLAALPDDRGGGGVVVALLAARVAHVVADAGLVGRGLVGEEAAVVDRDVRRLRRGVREDNVGLASRGGEAGGRGAGVRARVPEIVVAGAAAEAVRIHAAGGAGVGAGRGVVAAAGLVIDGKAGALVGAQDVYVVRDGDGRRVAGAGGDGAAAGPGIARGEAGGVVGGGRGETENAMRGNEECGARAGEGVQRVLHTGGGVARARAVDPRGRVDADGAGSLPRDGVAGLIVVERLAGGVALRHRGGDPGGPVPDQHRVIPGR